MSDVNVVVQMIENKEGLTSKGRPRVSELEARLGRDVTTEERDSLYDQAIEIVENGGEEPPAPAPAPKRRVNPRGGLGGW